jgi:RND superfamily putative drug exporter
VLADLRERFDAILETLEAVEGWVTVRLSRPVLILGWLDGIETGIRRLVRRRPLEVEEVEVLGRRLRVPTLAETLRVKAWLVVLRNATRDYLDVVALADRMGADAAGVILGLDDFHADQLGPGGRRVATQVARQLADPAPYDLSEVDLRHYRRLDARWRDWANVVPAARSLASDVLDLVVRAGA